MTTERVSRGFLNEVFLCKREMVWLAAGINQIQMVSSVNGWAYTNNIVGQSYGSIGGTRILKNANGQTVVNATTGVQALGKV